MNQIVHPSFFYLHKGVLPGSRVKMRGHLIAHGTPSAPGLYRITRSLRTLMITNFGLTSTSRRSVFLCNLFYWLSPHHNLRFWRLWRLSLSCSISLPSLKFIGIPIRQIVMALVVDMSVRAPYVYRVWISYTFSSGRYDTISVLALIGLMTLTFDLWL